MSAVLPTDKTLVNRAGVDHSAPADMSTVQDTDLLLINRAGVDYKCTFADWKASQVHISTPSITSPAAAATDLGETPTFTSSAFSAVGAVTHVSSDWQVTLATDTAFAAPVVQSMADAANKVSWKGGPLGYSISYLVRVRHNGTGISSAWSAAVAFSTASAPPNATLSPGKFYFSSNQTASGFGLPFMTALPANSDGTSYIDLCSCADSTPALLLDTNNALWVVRSTYATPAKATPPCTGKVIKIAGGYLPNYLGNALALTDTGELWRGWSLGSSPQWQMVTLAFPTSEIVSMFSQAYGDKYGLLVERKNSSGTQWYRIPASLEALGTAVPIGPVGALQVVLSNPFNATPTPYWIQADGRIGSTATVTTTNKYKKLIGAGFISLYIVGLAVDGTLEFIAGDTGAIPLPVGETFAKDLILPVTGYAGRSFLLGGSGKVYITAANVDGGTLKTATWLEMTELRDKYGTFGTLSSQAPVIPSKFSLIVPN